MAEYWKSLPRKFCDVCKCWFADNKASIDFHERGKRHQENAQKRIQDIQKRGIKEFKKQQKLEEDMEKIEKAALAAYQKDLQMMQNSKTQEDLVPVKKENVVLEDVKNTKSSSKVLEKKTGVVQNIKISKPKELPLKIPTKVWYEAMSEDGYKYYWNSETSESSWDPPKEGFISIEEQEFPSEGKNIAEENVTVKEENVLPMEEKDLPKEENDLPVCSVGPQPKVDPYGQWVTVEKKEPVEYDLQLPKQSENNIEVTIHLHKDDSSLKFKEKVIGQLTDCDSSEITFKKRKLSMALKKNVRQRTADD